MTNSSIDQLTILPPCNDSLELVFADPGFLLIEKPAGLLSVPGRHPKNWDCVISRLEGEYPTVAAIHRLDFDTSGIMVVSLNKAAHRAIARQFQERETKKVYTAVVAGRLAELEGVIDAPIAPDLDHRPKCKISSSNGKAAITHFKVLSHDASANTSRLLLYPKTGRSHQLRLHLSYLGHPILGCDFYAPEDIRAASSRLLLHATELHFQHPTTKKWVSGISQCPF